MQNTSLESVIYTRRLTTKSLTVSSIVEGQTYCKMAKLIKIPKHIDCKCATQTIGADITILPRYSDVGTSAGGYRSISGVPTVGNL